MTEDARQRIVVDAVSFGQIFRFHHLLKCIVQAMQPPRLLVAVLVMFALTGGGKLWDELFEAEPTFGPAGLIETEAEQAALVPGIIREQLAQWTADSPFASSSQVTEQERVGPTASQVRRWVIEDFAGHLADASEAEAIGDLKQRKDEFRRRLELLEAYEPKPVFQATAEQTAESFVNVIQGVFSFNPQVVFESTHDVLVRMPLTLWDANKPFCIFFGLYALIVIAIGGGALCRMSACEYAGRERLRAADGLMFATRSWVKLVLGPLMPLVIAGILALVLIAGGTILFHDVPYLQPLTTLLGGLLYPIALLLAFLIAFVLLVFVGGFPMMVPAVAVENCGPADAMQRAYAYFLGRPFHLLSYATVLLVGLSIGYLVVSAFAVTILNVTGTMVQGFVHSDEPAIAFAGSYEMFDLTPPAADVAESWYDGWAYGLIAMWQGIVVMLVAAWVVSFLFSSSTVLYLLMRKAVDDQDPTEIWRPGLLPGTLVPVARTTPAAFSATLPTTDAPLDEEADSVDEDHHEDEQASDKST